MFRDVPTLSDHRTLSELRAPLRGDPEGPDRSLRLPAYLSPPPASQRLLVQPPTNASSDRSRESRHPEDRGSRYNGYDQPSSYQVPIHTGSPIRTSLPPSPYPPHSNDTRRGYEPLPMPNSRPRSTETQTFSGRVYESQGVPPPPMPYRNEVHHESFNGYRTSPNQYQSRSFAHGSASYGNAGYGEPHHGNGAYQPAPSMYHPLQNGLPVAPSGYGSYLGHPGPPHQNGSHRPVQFENEEVGQTSKKRRGNLPKDTTDILKQWFMEHLGHPYPTEDEKQSLCHRTGLQMTQVSCIEVCDNTRR